MNTTSENIIVIILKKIIKSKYSGESSNESCLASLQLFVKSIFYKLNLFLFKDEELFGTRRFYITISN